MGNLAPTSKMTAVGAAAFVTTILLWALREFGKIELPMDVAAAVGGLISFMAGWMTSEPTSSPPGDAPTAGGQS